MQVILQIDASAGALGSAMGFVSQAGKERHLIIVSHSPSRGSEPEASNNYQN